MINESVIRTFLSNFSIIQSSGEELKSHDDLRNIGLNSITAIDLIVSLEEKFNITISDEDLIIDNVCTIDKIIQLLNKYLD